MTLGLKFGLLQIVRYLGTFITTCEHLVNHCGMAFKIYPIKVPWSVARGTPKSLAILVIMSLAVLICFDVAFVRGKENLDFYSLLLCDLEQHSSPLSQNSDSFGCLWIF